MKKIAQTLFAEFAPWIYKRISFEYNSFWYIIFPQKFSKL